MKLLIGLFLCVGAGPALASIQGEEVLIPALPEESLVDQDGNTVQLRALIGNRPAVLNFIFTRCTTICTPLSATMAALQKETAQGQAIKPLMVSISLDPEYDTPQRLKAFGEKFHRQAGWSLLTGSKEQVDKVLSALGGAVSRKEAHSPEWLVGDGAKGRWKRLVGLGIRSTDLLATIRALGETEMSNVISQQEAAARYFTNTELIDQDGRHLQFYRDLIAGKTVIINFAFTSCKGACSPITANLAKVQKLLGDKLERDIRLVTISVDPRIDSPETLKKYAAKFGQKPGWYFLTGTEDNVKSVLKKLGGLTKTPDEHPTTVFIGDARLGIWTKTFGSDRPETIADAAEHIGIEKK
jgi:protein SCO1